MSIHKQLASSKPQPQIAFETFYVLRGAVEEAESLSSHLDFAFYTFWVVILQKADKGTIRPVIRCPPIKGGKPGGCGMTTMTTSKLFAPF